MEILCTENWSAALGLRFGLALCFWVLCGGLGESMMLYYRCDEMFRGKERVKPFFRRLAFACERVLLVIGAVCFAILLPVPIPKFLFACILTAVASLPLKTTYPLPNRARNTMLFFDSVARFAMGFPLVLLMMYLAEAGAPIWPAPVLTAFILYCNWYWYEDLHLVDSSRCIEKRHKLGMLNENFSMKYTAIGGCAFFIVSTLAISFVA